MGLHRSMVHVMHCMSKYERNVWKSIRFIEWNWTQIYDYNNVHKQPTNISMILYKTVISHLSTHWWYQSCAELFIYPAGFDIMMSWRGDAFRITRTLWKESTRLNKQSSFLWCVTVTSNDRHGVSHYRSIECLQNSLFTLTTKKYQRIALLSLCEGPTSGGSVDSPQKGTVTRKMFPFGDVIMSKRDTIALVWRDCNRTGIFPVTWIRLTHWDMADNYRPHFHMHILEWIFLNFKFHCRKFVSNCSINNKSAFELGNGLAQIRRQSIT